MAGKFEKSKIYLKNSKEPQNYFKLLKSVNFQTQEPTSTTLNLTEIRLEIDINCHWFNEIFCAMETVSHQGTPFSTCSGKGTSITSQNSTLTKILFNKNETLEALLIRNQNFKYFPLNLSDLMPDLKAIQIIASGLREITARDLENFTNLTSLWLPRNEIETLESGIFDKNLKLRKLSFYGNNLKFIGATILDGLKSLIFVSFERNVCIDLAGEGEEGVNLMKHEISVRCGDEGGVKGEGRVEPLSKL